ncbi:MAG TPA: DUF2298 domain-containing protein [bacterium]|nr:DUF2298 domain-containing protein [bacterium]
MGPLLVWWLVVVLLGWALLPLSFLVFRHLPDKGYGASKVLALLLMGYFSWILGYAGFNYLTICLALGILLAMSALFFSQTWNGIRKFFKERLGYVLVVEMLFFMGFLAAGAYKMHTHDIVGTEKPMDFAMINGILASPSMPPQDPWLSGGSISYYYFGYLIISVLSRLTGTMSGVGYNLGVVLIWALAAVAAFSLAYNLTQRYRYSIFSVIAVTVLGNLDYWYRAFLSFKQGDLRITYYNFPPDPGAATGFPGLLGFLFSPLQHYWDYFQASRILLVPPTDKMINEFPSFSFFLSDLHPHVMAIPFGLLCLSFCLNLLKAPLPGLGVFGVRPLEQGFQWALAAILFGGIAFMNSWDFPALLLLLGICLAFQQRWASPKDPAEWFKGLCLVGLPVVAGCFVFYAPFYARFQSQANGLGIVKDRTEFYGWLVLFGLFFAWVVEVFAARAREASELKEPKTKASREIPVCRLCGKENPGKKFCGHCGGEVAPLADIAAPPIAFKPVADFLSSLGEKWADATRSESGMWFWLAGIVLVLSLLDVFGHWAVLGLTLLVFALGMLSLGRKSESRELIFSTFLVILAFGLMGFCELFYIRDQFAGGALYRMNTVFKFHYQAWIFLSAASAPFLKWLVENQWPRWGGARRWSWGAVFGLMFLGAALYPFLALIERTAGTGGVLTLDGTDYFQRTYPSDFQAVEWIKQNLKPVGGKAPVILEAWGGSYSDYARLATHTGYPTVLGWDFHEAQWRGAWDKPAIRGGDAEDNILTRRQDVDTIYTTKDLGQARALLAKYGVTAVYVGGLEREKYKDHLDALGKFVQWGAPVSFGDSVLYKLNP